MTAFAHECMPVLREGCGRAANFLAPRSRHHTLSRELKTLGRGHHQEHGNRRTTKPQADEPTISMVVSVSTIGAAITPIAGTITAADAPSDAPTHSGTTISTIYEYVFSRRRIADPLEVVRSPDVASAILRLYLRPDEAEQERLAVALLDVKNSVIGVLTVYLGNTSGATVRVAEVFRDAVRLNASALVVAHNHPSGDPAPSAEDLALTSELAAAGRLLDIELLDHLILGDEDRTVSMRALGQLDPSRHAGRQ